ncbi:hypothetical protein N9M11_04080 [Flavobacteriaceae bacterium]|uniref:TlpA family protein disulfide reductase n=1 Tax=Candidatus Arcticimaribacter forsetii TaxID=2820661 RepID=UPI00207781A8|nr:hypothetical protein [Candidatus Arcticimaribacter forsetii]MDA8699273.1 hypothetical protein [Flavobacteriaceae bacterium]MDB2325598.1 hypothetical protein [Flavobacteriaceae bacterium]MDB4620624.1 hypothetical protein [Flavobacteriaceae bacterium]MDB4674461.1 hypothetical protein [Flavobacteriaceae bacterium]MDB4738335.1 hypothetical protein [Flavobacteriaceae bacterium]
MKKAFYIVLLYFVYACSSESVPEGAFLGGQIINPSSKTVSIYKNNKLLDSIVLGANNRFERSYDSLDYGIFKFEHLPESQTLLIEKGDSIWFRTNTTDFNSSLVFSGRGSAKNNFLMEIYLSLQKESSFLASKYSNKSSDFGEIIDSLLQEKRENWIKFDSINQLSPEAKIISQASYVYPYANRKERYALIRGRNITLEQDSLYFNFRKYLNFGEENLAYFEPYITYMLNFLNQEALVDGENFFQAKQTTEFNIRRLALIDQLIPTENLRNNLARTVAYEELINFKNFKHHDQFLKYYVTVNTSPEYELEIISLQASLMKMQVNQPLPEIMLEDTEFQNASSVALLKGQKTVLYFWSQTQMNHYKRTQERVKQYKNEFPEFRFVGICIQSYNKLVRDYQKVMEINPKNQFAFVDFENARKKWVLTLLNKGIVIDEKGIILEGFGNFYSPNFKEILEKNHR